MSKSVVLITGALTGIGRATAIEFAKQGANIVVSGRKDEVGLQLQAELKGLGADATYIRSDVRDDNSVKYLIDEPSLNMVVWTSQSITLVLKVNQALSPNRQPRNLLLRSRPMYWVCYSA